MSTHTHNIHSSLAAGRHDFLERHHIPNVGIELLVYIYYAAFYAFWPVAAINDRRRL